MFYQKRFPHPVKFLLLKVFIIYRNLIKMEMVNPYEKKTFWYSCTVSGDKQLH